LLLCVIYPLIVVSMRNTAFGDGSIDVNSGGGGIYATFFTGGLSAGREDLGTFYLIGYVGGGYNSYGTRRDALAGNATGSTEGGQFKRFSR